MSSTTIHKYPLVSLFFIFAVIFLFVLPYIQLHVHEINDVTKEAELENQYRATLAQILGGVAIAIGLYGSAANFFSYFEVIIATFMCHFLDDENDYLS